MSGIYSLVMNENFTKTHTHTRSTRKHRQWWKRIMEEDDGGYNYNHLWSMNNGP